MKWIGNTYRGNADTYSVKGFAIGLPQATDYYYDEKQLVRYGMVGIYKKEDMKKFEVRSADDRVVTSEEDQAEAHKISNLLNREAKGIYSVYAKEEFTKENVTDAIKLFLKYGEETFNPEEKLKIKGHKGYYSGNGWAARALRSHLEDLTNEN
jgi:hypothetical protein